MINATLSSTKDYSTIGNSSIKMTPMDISTEWYVEIVGNNRFNEVGKTVTLTVDIYSNTNCRLIIYDLTNNYNSNSITVPANTPGTYQVSKQISENATQEWYRITKNNANSSDFIYIDNWRLTFQ